MKKSIWLITSMASFLLFFSQALLASPRTELFISSLSEEQERWPGFKLSNYPVLIADKEENTPDIISLTLKFPNSSKIFTTQIKKDDPSYSLLFRNSNISYSSGGLTNEVLEKFIQFASGDDKSFLKSYKDKFEQTYFWSFLPTLEENQSDVLFIAPDAYKTMCNIVFPPGYEDFAEKYKRAFAEIKDELKDLLLPSPISDSLGTFYHEAFHFMFQNTNPLWPTFARISSDDEVTHVCYDRDEKTETLYMNEIRSIANAFTSSDIKDKKQHLKQFISFRKQRYEHNKDLVIDFSSFDLGMSSLPKMNCELAEAKLEFHEGWPQFLTYAVPLEKGLLTKNQIANNILLNSKIKFSMANTKGARPYDGYYYPGALQWMLMKEILSKDQFSKILAYASTLPENKKFILYQEIEKLLEL